MYNLIQVKGTLPGQSGETKMTTFDEANKIAIERDTLEITEALNKYTPKNSDEELWVSFLKIKFDAWKKQVSNGTHVPPIPALDAFVEYGRPPKELEYSLKQNGLK